MRNPNRLYDFYNKLRDIHIKYFPDLRFGQLMSNFFYWYGKDPFFPEDDRMLELLDEYVKIFYGGDKDDNHSNRS